MTTQNEHLIPNSNETPNLNNNNEIPLQNKKQYIISRNVGEDKMREIIETFEDPNQYLSLNPKIVVGLLPFKPSNYISNTLPMRTLTSIPNKQKFHTHFSARSNLTHRPFISNKKRTFSPDSLRTPNPLSIQNIKNSIHYQLENKAQLEELRNETKKREETSNKIGTDDLILNQIDQNSKDKYINQEKLLKIQKLHRVKSAKVSKNITKKVTKEENDLLYNRIEEFRIKKQMLDIIEHQKPIEEKFGKKYWQFNLRRPKEQEHLRFNYVNIGVGREIWKHYVDYPYQPFEAIQNPESIVKNKYSKIYNNKYFKEKVKKLKGKVPKMEEINKLKIEGKNLINEEFKFLDGDWGLENNDAKMRLYIDPFEKKENYVNEMTIKNDFKKVDKGICKCRCISSKTRNHFY